uniref:Uncharacterized protein n=1 Tax=Arundo donax TaxID=35708 RepID=A0A0A9CGP3_ARUDO
MLFVIMLLISLKYTVLIQAGDFFQIGFYSSAGILAGDAVQHKLILRVIGAITTGRCFGSVFLFEFLPTSVCVCYNITYAIWKYKWLYSVGLHVF